MLLAVHVACYIAAVVMVDLQKKYVSDMDQSGDGVDNAHRIMVATRTIADKYFPASATTRPWVADTLDTWVQRLGEKATEVKKSHYGVYLGFNTLRRLDNKGARSAPPASARRASCAAAGPDSSNAHMCPKTACSPAASPSSQTVCC
jgi:hypothetical protein